MSTTRLAYVSKTLPFSSNGLKQSWLVQSKGDTTPCESHMCRGVSHLSHLAAATLRYEHRNRDAAFRFNLEKYKHLKDLTDQHVFNAHLRLT